MFIIYIYVVILFGFITAHDYQRTNDNSNYIRVTNVQLLLYFELVNNLVNGIRLHYKKENNIIVNFPVDINLESRIHDYNITLHNDICEINHIPPIICEYLSVQVYYLMYEFQYNHTLLYHNNDSNNKMNIPSISLSYFNKIYVPLPKYFNAIKSEIQRLFNTFYIDQELLNMELTIYLDIINNNMLINIKKICFLHSVILEDHNYRILTNILDHIIQSKLIIELDLLIIINYGYQLNNTYIMNYKSKYPNVLYYQMYSDGSYFEIPTLRLLYQISNYLYNNQSLYDTHVLYLHTKGKPNFI